MIFKRRLRYEKWCEDLQKEDIWAWSRRHIENISNDEEFLFSLFADLFFPDCQTENILEFIARPENRPEKSIADKFFIVGQLQSFPNSANVDPIYQIDIKKGLRITIFKAISSWMLSFDSNRDIEFLERVQEELICSDDFVPAEKDNSPQEFLYGDYSEDNKKKFTVFVSNEPPAKLFCFFWCLLPSLNLRRNRGR